MESVAFLNKFQRKINLFLNIKGCIRIFSKWISIEYQIVVKWISQFWVFDLYKTFKIDPEEIIQLDAYLFDYFVKILKRLQNMDYEGLQKQKKLTI